MKNNTTKKNDQYLFWKDQFTALQAIVSLIQTEKPAKTDLDTKTDADYCNTTMY